MGDSGLLLLHGWATHSGVFVRQLGVFKNELNVIAPDLYDLVDEDAPDTFSLDTVVNDLADHVVASGIKNLFIFGWSLGGIVAAKLCARLADVTRGVIFCGFSPVFTKSDKNPYGMDQSAIDKLKTRIDASASNAIEEFVKLVMQGYIYTTGLQMINDIVLDEISEEKKGLLLSSLSLLEGTDYTEDVKAIKAKTLIIHGTEDKLCSLESAESMAGQIDDCELKIMEGASHIPFFTNSDDFNEIVMEFLKSFG
jgi:pimeloyl-[acyl-carrier protein] methyl ester esterase